ncbi:hypothetical protein PQC07_gp224 [Aeromonas phage D3]|uniref:Anti-CBASS protein Acb1 n=3 Tax=Ludhianavirus TaxID=3044751 RepID=A0A514A1S2_9CAUD|nr:putative RNA ligase/cyclic nucleotide phosphodiesterase [Aeromonas phage LAh10]YP_010668532.1 hypothetical protein PQC07_gp224 [Aeromonas phage D3]YP_010668797.1 hypothetical protein PQC08_gp226 [Aeromonas phage D6]QEP52354.1 hypothetical protein D9_0147 [Aeromonas phage D9]QDH47172.1 putative RNA ligase/cyclic nucleotide phosphodiesterase [Aeromonas phage LAh10]QDJ97048.1 hypothetical protein D3_0051 [Aeromonas phage D3]QDJ97209.1 hypothetical protein D6_0049 [Aeromonas phage D6]
MKFGYSKLMLDLGSASRIRKAAMKVIEGTEKEKDQAVLDVINIPATELHATLMYDKRNPDIIPDTNRASYKAKVTGVERLGTPGGNYYALVLLCESEGITKRHEELLEQGFKHSWPDLKIHVSLNYGDQVTVAYPIIKEAFEKGYLPTEVTLGAECWNECR